MDRQSSQHMGWRKSNPIIGHIKVEGVWYAVYQNGATRPASEKEIVQVILEKECKKEYINILKPIPMEKCDKYVNDMYRVDPPKKMTEIIYNKIIIG